MVLLVLDAEICNFQRFSIFFFRSFQQMWNQFSFALQIVIVLYVFWSVEKSLKQTLFSPQLSLYENYLSIPIDSHVSIDNL